MPTMSRRPRSEGDARSENPAFHRILPAYPHRNLIIRLDTTRGPTARKANNSEDDCQRFARATQRRTGASIRWDDTCRDIVVVELRRLLNNRLNQTKTNRECENARSRSLKPCRYRTRHPVNPKQCCSERSQFTPNAAIWRSIG
jgi:hypothetical protein